MKNNENVISTLLPMAKEDELRAFVQNLAENDDKFSIKLSQWLMSKYAVYVNKPSVYVDEVRRLFGQTEEKYRGCNRWRYYDDCSLDWVALSCGMKQIVSILREKLADGCPEVVPLPIVEFYRLLADYLDDLLAEEGVDINSEARACDSLLLAWAEHPGVTSQEKRELYETLQALSKAEILDYVEGLTDTFFMNYLTCTQSPEDALASIEKLSAEGKVTEEMAHKHIALLRSFGREDEALGVIRRRLCYRSVLDAELDRLYKQASDYAALNLLDLAAAHHHGAVDIEERKIRFLLRLGDTGKLIEVYRCILLNKWNGFDYYAKIKELVSAAEWPEQYRRIVEEGEKKSSGEFMARIYAEEADYPRLYQAVMTTRHDTLRMLQRYMPQLPQEYHEKLLQKGYAEIDNIAHRADKRSEYAHVTSLIRQFSALPGAKTLADTMVTNLRATYVRRPAYIDELSKL